MRRGRATEPSRGHRPERRFARPVVGDGPTTRARTLVRWFVAVMIGSALLPLAPAPAHAAVVVTAVQSGDWDDPATWGGAVPPATGASIAVPSTVRVTIPSDVAVDLATSTLYIDGVLFVLGSIDLLSSDVVNTASGELRVLLGTLTLDGTFTDESLVTNLGLIDISDGTFDVRFLTELRNNGEIRNDGTLHLGTRSEILNRGTIHNVGTIRTEGVRGPNGPVRGEINNQSGTILNHDELAVIELGGSLTNGDQFSSATSTVVNEGTIKVLGGNDQGALFINGYGPSWIENHALVDIAPGGYLVNNVARNLEQGFRNHAGAELRIESVRVNLLTGILVNESGGLLNILSAGTINNDSTIDNDGDVANAGTFDNQGVIRWFCNATLTGNAITGNPVQDRCDQAPPDIEVPQTITAEPTGPTGATVGYAIAVEDDKDPNPYVTCTPRSLSTFALGDTTVTCTAADQAGNESSASFHVIVVDTTAPTVTVLGQPSVTVVVNNPYADAGATATDVVDGDLTSAMATSNPVVTAVPGSYTVTYTAEDANENIGTATRQVVVITALDATRDLLTAIGALTLPAKDRDELRRLGLRVESLLNDGRTSNDRSSCQLLTTLDAAVRRKQTSSVLSSSDASSLLKRTAEIRIGIGC